MRGHAERAVAATPKNFGSTHQDQHRLARKVLKSQCDRRPSLNKKFFRAPWNEPPDITLATGSFVRRLRRPPHKQSPDALSPPAPRRGFSFARLPAGAASRKSPSRRARG